MSIPVHRVSLGDAWSSRMHPDMESERCVQSFSVELLTNILDGGAQHTALRRKVGKRWLGNGASGKTSPVQAAPPSIHKLGSRGPTVRDPFLWIVKPLLAMPIFPPPSEGQESPGPQSGCCASVVSPLRPIIPDFLFLSERQMGGKIWRCQKLHPGL